jgi:hypothetical protein
MLAAAAATAVARETTRFMRALLRFCAISDRRLGKAGQGLIMTLIDSRSFIAR